MASNEYLAYIAATTGDLAGALAVSTPDSEVLTAAGQILAALFAGGPAKDIDEYLDGAIATEWISLAQAYAGAPSAGRPAGLFPRRTGREDGRS